MPLDLLAVLTDPTGVDVVLSAAMLAAAHQPGATIRALYVDVDPDRIVAAPEEIDLQRLRALRQGGADDRLAAIEVAVADWRRRHRDTAISFYCRVGMPAEVVSCDGRGADLVILAHGIDLDSGDALHAALFALEAPVLLLPANWRPERWSRIAIAWSNTDAADKAVDAVRPWLARADTVRVVTLGEVSGGMELCGTLGLSGVHARLISRVRDQRSVGAQLIAVAHEIGADMLVAGAYRHNAAVEWLLGGTTRHLLANSDLPLLLAH